MSKIKQHLADRWIVVADTLWKEKFLVSREGHWAKFSKNIEQAQLYGTPQEATICLEFIKRSYPKMSFWVERVTARKVNLLNEPKRWVIDKKRVWEKG